MLAELPRRAFLEWAAYYEREPWGEDRADARSAIIASLIYNAHRRRGAPSRAPRDFLAYRAPRAPMSRAKLEAFKHLMRRANRADPD